MNKGSSGLREIPSTLLGLILRVSGRHQIWLALLSVAVFIADTAPIEVQRRLVNAAVKDGDVTTVLVLAGVFALLALGHGLLKLVLNLYRSWVSETAVKWLRGVISDLAQRPETALPTEKAGGVEISMVIAEADPIGGFVGSGVSEPLLQGGVMIAVICYLVYLQPLMAVVGVAVFVPQLFLIPRVQGAINRRVGVRIWALRKISVSLVVMTSRSEEANLRQERRVEQIFHLNMGILKLKFTLNFIMNCLTAIGTAVVLGLGGYYVIEGRTDVGTVVAFVSGLSKIASPWGDLVNWYREFQVTRERYKLVAQALRSELTGTSAG